MFRTLIAVVWVCSVGIFARPGFASSLQVEAEYSIPELGSILRIQILDPTKDKDKVELIYSMINQGRIHKKQIHASKKDALTWINTLHLADSSIWKNDPNCLANSPAWQVRYEKKTFIICSNESLISKLSAFHESVALKFDQDPTVQPPTK